MNYKRKTTKQCQNFIVSSMQTYSVTWLHTARCAKVKYAFSSYSLTVNCIPWKVSVFLCMLFNAWRAIQHQGTVLLAEAYVWSKQVKLSISHSIVRESQFSFLSSLSFLLSSLLITVLLNDISEKEGENCSTEYVSLVGYVGIMFFQTLWASSRNAGTTFYSLKFNKVDE